MTCARFGSWQVKAASAVSLPGDSRLQSELARHQHFETETAGVEDGLLDAVVGGKPDDHTPLDLGLKQ